MTAIKTIMVEVFSNVFAFAESVGVNDRNDSIIFETTVSPITSSVSLGVHVVVQRAKNTITGQAINIVDELLLESYATWMLGLPRGMKAATDLTIIPIMKMNLSKAVKRTTIEGGVLTFSFLEKNSAIESGSSNRRSASGTIIMNIPADSDSR